MEFLITEVENGVTIVAVDGGLDASNAQEFKDAIDKLVDAGLTRLIIDCSKLHAISSFGVGVLLGIHSRMKTHGGDVKLASLHGLVFDVLKLMRLDSLFDIHDDVSRAQLAFREPDSE